MERSINQIVKYADLGERKEGIRIGAWARTSAAGNRFYSTSNIVIPPWVHPGDVISVMIMKNSFKEEGDNKPDLNVTIDVHAPKGGTKAASPDNRDFAAREDDIPF